MYLQGLNLENFRSFEKDEILFGPELSILVGENNSGKSNIIDAIRLLTFPLNGRREIYCEPTDIRFDSKKRNFELSAQYTDLNSGQQGRLITATTKKSLTDCIYGLNFEESKDLKPNRPDFWAGCSKGTPESGSERMIRHVYLPPLRDAKRYLASGNPTRIYSLLQHFLGSKSVDEVANEFRREDDFDILKDINKAVNSGLNALTSGVRTQSTELGFAKDEKLIDIARDLRFRLADSGIDPEDLRYSSHGYANLLYIATIAVELLNLEDVDLTLFLVEEPEAHLHPQLQAAILSFLDDQVKKLRKSGKNSHEPSGELQVIITTHSPNLTAWVESKNIIAIRSILQSQRNGSSANIANPAFDKDLFGNPTNSKTKSPASDINFRRAVSRCIPIRELKLKKKEFRKIDRYIDVTKSSLLFGGRVILVEGIAEAILLPAIANKILKKNTIELRIFRSIVLVPIGGIDFLPYAKLLLSNYNGVQVAKKVCVITDGDMRFNKSNGLLEDGLGASREKELRKFAKNQNAGDKLDVFLNQYSLETEILLRNKGSLLREEYRAIRPNSVKKWDTIMSMDINNNEEKSEFHSKVSNEIFYGSIKGDFAQLLAEKIRTDTSFVVPEYLENAVRSSVIQDEE